MRRSCHQTRAGASTSPGSAEEILSVAGLSASYGSKRVFEGLRFSLRRGELAAVIGPNGAGKTTLLHCLCGIHREATGQVHVAGRALHALSRREVARQIALVPQGARIDFHITVEDAVALGRYPWLGPVAPQGAGDRQVVAAALERLGLTTLRDRPLQTLSGGERQRVMLARALAQETPLLYLDEPAASLDLRYQQDTFLRLKELATTRHVAILVAEHRLNLVGATCDRVLVLHQGRLWADGAVEEILTEELIATVFGARMQVLTGAGGRPQCIWRLR